jgi:hypothetical protein
VRCEQENTEIFKLRSLRETCSGKIRATLKVTGLIPSQECDLPCRLPVRYVSSKAWNFLLPEEMSALPG